MGADFYQDMAAMVKEVLAPSPQGGLGQTDITLIRRVMLPGEKEWLPIVPSEKSETLRASATTVSIDMVDGENVLAEDIRVVSSVPTAVSWRLGEADKAEVYILLNGERKAVISAKPIPRAGTPVAIEFLVR